MSLKVLYILHSSSIYEGSNRSFLSMLDNLLAKQVNPYVILPKKPDTSIVHELDKRNVPYRILKYILPIYPKVKSLKDALLYFPRILKIFYCEYTAVKATTQLAKDQSVNIIHSNAGPVFIGHKTAISLNLPHVWHLREFQDLDFHLHTLYSMRQFIKKLKSPRTYPIAISQHVYEHFELAEPACMIYNGIQAEKELVFTAQKENYFLYVGSLSDSKGIRELLYEFAAFLKHNKTYKLYVVGSTNDIEYRKLLDSIIHQNQMTEHVLLLGHRNDVNHLMSKATALIVPSVYEAFGRITAEAVYNGCIVIGRNTGGTKEILELLQCGILYNDNNELKNIMQNIANNGTAPHLEKVKAAQTLAAQYFSYEQNGDSVYNYYKQILSGN